VNEIERQRLRLLYSLGDFQLALSACEFLYECEADKKYSKIELRRFRCYETAMITAYTRPFSQSRGTIPKLSLKMTGAQLSAEQIELHEKLMTLRNKAVAHSDAEAMRMLSHTSPIDFPDGAQFQLLQAVFDEGLTFIGPELINVNELIHRIFNSTYTKLLKEAQHSPKEFNLQRDCLNE
jgi:hypothetical protein